MWWACAGSMPVVLVLYSVLTALILLLFFDL